MARWLKLGYFTAALEADSGYWLERYWISDSPGRKSSRWKKRTRPRRGKTYPIFGPRYEVGDRLVIYITGLGVCPAVVEVTGPPRWDPGWVDEKSGKKEGDTWGVVTPVEGLWTKSLSAAPAVERIGVAKSRLERKGHIRLTEEEYQEAERLIRGRRPSRGKAKATSIEVPLEESQVEGYEIRPSTKARRARRREAALVHDYGRFLEAMGDEVKRNEVWPLDATHALHTDLYNATRQHLVEAKAGVGRGEIRMAIGQLADYARFVSPVKRRAVLLEAKPTPDLLALLESQGIGAVWRLGEGFEDNAEGAFT